MDVPKTIAGILTLLALSSPMALHAQRTRLGHVNTAEILDSMPEMKAAKLRIDSMGKADQRQMQVLQDQLDEANRNNAAMEAYNLKLRMGFLKVELDSEIAQKSDEIFAPIRKKVNDAIEDVAREKRISIVLDSRYDAIVLYASKRTDLTKLVEKKLGL